MFEVTAYDNHLELRIVSSNGRSIFAKNTFGSSILFDDLERLKTSGIDPTDMTYKREKKVWVITNPDKYLHIPYIADAIEKRKMQPSLF